MKLLNEKIILLIGVGSGCPKIFLGKKINIINPNWRDNSPRWKTLWKIY